MDNLEFLDFRGQKLVATTTWVGGQEFVLAAIPVDRQDSTTAEILAQQNIEIVPGLKITDRSGKLFEILSRPTGFSKHVRIKDVRRDLTPINVTEDELRRNFRFTSM
jgi:hypothetical protein